MMSEDQARNMEEARSLSLDPLMEKRSGELAGDILKRLLVLVSKLISFKSAIFAVFVILYLKVPGGMSAWTLVVVAGIVIFGREFLKVAKDFVK